MPYLIQAQGGEGYFQNALTFANAADSTDLGGDANGRVNVAEVESLMNKARQMALTDPNMSQLALTYEAFGTELIELIRMRPAEPVVSEPPADRRFGPR